MDIKTVMKRHNNLQFDLKSYLRFNLFWSFDNINYREYLFKKRYSLKIKGYKNLLVNKITCKNRVGNILLELLNNSSKILQILKDYRRIISEYKANFDIKSQNLNYYKNIVFPIFSVMSYDLLQVSPYTITIIKHINSCLYDLTYFDTCAIPQDYLSNLDFCIYMEVVEIESSLSDIEKIYARTSTNTKGYVTYDNPIIKTPTCKLSFKKTRKNSKPYLYSYHLINTADLFNVSVYSLSLTNYKVYKCDICGKYFTSKKTRKTCSKICENKADELRKEKNRNRNRFKNSDSVNNLYRKIKNFYNKTLKNKNKQAIRDNMRRDFEIRYDKKIKALNKQYSSSLNEGYQNQLLKWLENEYKKIQKVFPSKKYGNTNHSYIK